MRAWLKLLLLLSDEAIVVLAVLFILWKLDVHLPTALLVAIATVVAVIVFLLHWILLSELKEGRLKSTNNNMIGLKGKVIMQLCPEGVVKIRGELWKAITVDVEVEAGRQIYVTGREGLRLLVECCDPPQRQNIPTG